MGYYIQTPEPKQKANQLVCIHGAEIIDQPQAFSQIPSDKMLICVVQNALFDAALVCLTENDFLRAKDTHNDPRPRTWLTMDKSWPNLHSLLLEKWLVKEESNETFKPLIGDIKGDQSS